MINLDTLIDSIIDVPKEQEKQEMYGFIRTMDLNELVATIHPTPQEWRDIMKVRHLDFTEEFIVKHWTHLPKYTGFYYGFITPEVFKKASTSADAYWLCKLKRDEVSQVVQEWQSRDVLNVEHLKEALSYIPEEVILTYFTLDTLEIDELGRIFNNLHVSDKFLIERKELFWECTRKQALRRIFSSELLEAFKLVPHRVLPEEYKKFSKPEDSTYIGYSTLEAKQMLDLGILLEDELD